jgi:hypothetical protein
VLITAKVDIYPPPAPALPTATVLSAVSIRVDWQAVTDPNGISGYQLERATGGGGFSALASVSALTYTDTGLTPATQYQYRVRAVDNEGYIGAFSSVVTATTASVFGWTIPDTTYALGTITAGGTVDLSQFASTGSGSPAYTLVSGPSGMTVGQSTGVLTTTGVAVGSYTVSVDLSNLIVQVTGLAASNVYPTSLDLSWTAAPYATSYHVEQSTDGTTWTQIANPTDPSYAVTGLSESTTYYFRVRGTNGVHSGAYSATVTVTTTAQPSTGEYEPVIEPEVQVEQFQVWDDGVSSPKWDYWNPDLWVRWVNVNVGDFTDANGVAQGTTPFVSVTTPTAATTYSFDVATLVSRAVTTGQNKGFYLSLGGSSPNVSISGRLGTNPPTLQVVTSAGTFNCPCSAMTTWGWPPGTSLPSNTRTSGVLNSSRRGIVRFNLNGVTGTVLSATMQLHVLTRSGTSTAIRVFEANPPTFQVGLKPTDTPVPGLAASFPGDNFGADSRVLKAGNFTGATRTSLSGSASTWNVPQLWTFEARNAVSIVPDAAAPGTSYWRGEFVPVQTGTDPRREALKASYTVMFPDFDEPGYPIDTATYKDDLYYRMYVMLEDDFTSTIEANKMGISWDLRFGYWIVSDNENGGYWQNVGGNGGNPGDGTHTYPFTDSRVTDAHIYRGNYQRMESGVFLADGPYTDLRPWLGYNYQIDTDVNPAMRPYTDIVDMKFRRGRWYCIEQRCRLNTIDLTSPDAYGNGIANADGLLETWVNGVKVSSQADYKWRRHPAMGIKGVNTNWYLGGQASHPIGAGNMHFRINHVVLATQYIGPRVRP